jgi:uncharacterized protein GlcG (DUF336 family)
VKFRRPTKVFEDGIQKNDYKYQLSLDDIIASRGGIPLIEDGKLIGAIGCSGGRVHGRRRDDEQVGIPRQSRGPRRGH